MDLSIDGSTLKTREELHAYLKNKLELPDYYGSNLDALWDCLVSWVPMPLSIEWVNYGKSELYLGDYAEKMLGLFKEAEKGFPDKISISVA